MLFAIAIARSRKISVVRCIIIIIYFNHLGSLLLQGNTTTNSIIRAVQNLGEVIMESAGTPVDQTRANLNTTAVILDNVANYIQTQRGSNTTRRIVRCP